MSHNHNNNDKKYEIILCIDSDTQKLIVVKNNYNKGLKETFAQNFSDSVVNDTDEYIYLINDEIIATVDDISIMMLFSNNLTTDNINYIKRINIKNFTCKLVEDKNKQYFYNVNKEDISYIYIQYINININKYYNMLGNILVECYYSIDLIIKRIYEHEKNNFKDYSINEIFLHIFNKIVPIYVLYHINDIYMNIAEKNIKLLYPSSEEYINNENSPLTEYIKNKTKILEYKLKYCDRMLEYANNFKLENIQYMIYVPIIIIPLKHDVQKKTLKNENDDYLSFLIGSK